MSRLRTQRMVSATVMALAGVLGSACAADLPPSPSAPPDPSSTPVPSVTQNRPPSDSPAPRTTSPSRLPPPASTAVPQPEPGDINSTEPAPPEETRKPVPLKSPAVAGQLKARITRVQAVDAEARGPGEVSGPGVAVTVSVENESARSVDLGATVVTLEDAEGAPGGEILGPPTRPLGGKLGAGKSTRGVYVFTVGRKRREPITVRVTLGPGLAPLVFRGNAV